jgi:plastocyanin
MSRHLQLCVGAALAALAISACGSSSSNTTSSGAAASSGSSSGGSSYAPPASTSSTSSSSSSSTGSASSSSSGGAAASVLNISANPSGQLMFSTSHLTAKAGKVTIHFTNKAPIDHDLSVQVGTGATGTVLGATGAFTGGTRTLVLTLKPGTYTYFCNVPGHRAAGMQGTLTVVS